MNKIKFRVWDNEDKKVYPVAAISFENEVIFRLYCITGSFEGNPVGKYLKDKECHIMQSAGLVDKMGTEIYEGDILKIVSELYTHFGKVATGKFDTTYKEVIWYEDSWGYRVLKSKTTTVGFECRGLKVAAKYAEVVGNIYENPDLIN